MKGGASDFGRDDRDLAVSKFQPCHRIEMSRTELCELPRCHMASRSDQRVNLGELASCDRSTQYAAQLAAEDPHA